jgi:fermentation-respiration switch protein FrsA (DUF1100 family)
MEEDNVTTEHKRYQSRCQATNTVAPANGTAAGASNNGVFWKRALLLGAGALGAAGITMGLGSLAFAYLSTHPVRRPLRSTPDDYGLPFEDIVFPSRDGMRLSGWFVPFPGARAGVILCHGFPSNREEMLFWARMLYPEGFHLLLFDFRALGESEGDLCSIGYHEVNDLLGAVDYLTARPEMQGLPVGVFGLSMGGAVSLMTAAQDERIAAVATHGAYASLARAIAQHCRVYVGPLGPLLDRQASWWGRRWFPLEPRCVSPVDVVGRIAPRPVLLFHGGRDFIVRPDDAHALYRAAGEPKQLHLLPRSWHVRIDAEEQPAYEKTVMEFFRKYLKGR